MKNRGFIMLDICLSIVLVAIAATLFATTLWHANHADNFMRSQRASAYEQKRILSELIQGHAGALPHHMIIKQLAPTTADGLAWIVISQGRNTHSVQTIALIPVKSIRHTLRLQKLRSHAESLLRGPAAPGPAQQHKPRAAL
ncbi:MAG: hypothetical protein ACP5O7_02445 [Phycisphaerae bacterium]